MNIPAPAISTSQATRRRPYVAPALTVYGPATVLTQDPQQSRPRETTPAASGMGSVRIFFLGDNA